MSKDDVAATASQPIAQQFTIEASAKAHREVIERLRNQVNVQTHRSAKELELSVKNLEKEFRKMGIIEEEATSAKILHHKRSIEKLEARFVNVSLISSTAEKHRFGAWDNQTRRNDVDFPKNFYKMLNSEAASLRTGTEKTDNMIKLKRKGKRKLHKIRKLLGLSIERLSAEPMAKESLSKETKLSRDAMPTRKAGTPRDEEKELRSQKRSCSREETLSVSRQRKPKNEEEPAHKKEKAHAKRPWYKFWQK